MILLTPTAEAIGLLRNCWLQPSVIEDLVFKNGIIVNYFVFVK